jgi:hypothetical protein
VGVPLRYHAIPLYPQNLALNFADNWVRSVGIFRLLIKGHEVRSKLHVDPQATTGLVPINYSGTILTILLQDVV